MRRCTVCHDTKPTTGPDRAFSPRQARCKSCRAEVIRLNRLTKAGKPVPLPSRYLAPYNHAKRLLRAIDTGTVALPLDVPVRVRGRLVPAPSACAIRECHGELWVYIASQRGSKQLQFASTAPEALVYALEALGLELILPTDTMLGSEKLNTSAGLDRKRQP